MNLHQFAYEYTFLFLFIYSLVLISFEETAYIGWWSLTVTQFLIFAYFLSYSILRADEPAFYFLFLGFSLTLASLGMIVNKLKRYYKKDPSSTEDKNILMIPSSKQYALKETTDFVIANVSLLVFIFLVFKIGSVKHISPFYVQRRSEYSYAPVHIVQYRQYPYFIEYCIPWLCGMSQIATLGLSGYLFFLAYTF